MALRIKSDIDLKELEKYGFQLDERNKYCEYGYDKYDVTIWFETEKRILRCSTPNDYNLEDSDSHLETLYDLIKDGLVIKEEEE